MKIVWDEPKRLTNLANRQLDFADLLDGEFFMSARILPANKGRLMAIGYHQGSPHTVIFKALGTEAISLISLRRASRKERQDYEES